MVNPKRSRAGHKALSHFGTTTVSPAALSRQARSAAQGRGAADRSRAAQRAVNTKGAGARHSAAVKAARTRKKSSS